MTIEELKVIIKAETSDIKKKTQQVRDSLKDLNKQSGYTSKATKSVEESNRKAGNAAEKYRKDIRNLGNEMRSTLKRFHELSKNAKIKAGVLVQTDGYKKVIEDIRQAEKAIDKLKTKQDNLTGKAAKTMTKAYTEYVSRIGDAEKKLESLKKKQEEWASLGGAIKKSGPFQQLEFDIGEVNKEILKYRNEMRQLEESGKAFTPGDKFVDLQNQIEEATENLRRHEFKKKRMGRNGTDYEPAKGTGIKDTAMAYISIPKKKIKEFTSRIRDLITAVIKSNTLLSHFASVIQRIGSVAQRVGRIISAAWNGVCAVFQKTAELLSMLGKSILMTFAKPVKAIGRFLQKLRSLASALNQTKKSSDRLSDSCGKLMGRFGALRITATYMLASFMIMGGINALKEGFKNLSQYSSKTNADLSRLMSALTQLKNSFATAFAPVLSVVAPILSKLIGWLSSAMNALAHFFAALTGQGKVVVAKKVNQDFASSIEGTGDAADDAKKKAEKYKRTLMGFDQINKLDAPEKKTDSGTGELSPGDMFETVEVDNKYKALADKVKGYFSDLFAPIKAAWDTYGKGVMDTWKSALKSVWVAVKDIGKSFMEVWTNGTGYTFCSNILILVRDIGEAIKGFATAFRGAWNEGGRGTALIQGIFDLFNSILSLIHTIGQSLLTVWNNGTGEKIIGHILDIFTNIVNTIKNIGENLKKAWSEDNLGTKIIQGLADIFENLLGHVKNITKSFETWAKKLDFKPLLKAFDGLVQALKPLGDKIGAGLEWLFKNVLQPLAKWAIEQGIPAAMDAISGALKFIDSVLDALKPVAKWIWEKFLKPLAKWTGGAIVTTLKGIGDAFSFLADIISDPKKYVAKIKAKFEDTKEKIKAKWGKIVSGVKDKWGSLKAKVSSKASDIKKKWEDVTGGWKDKATDLKAKVETKAEEIKTKWGNVTQGWKDKVTGLKSNVLTKAQDIRSKWSSVTGGWKDKLTSLKTSAVTKADTIKSKWGSVTKWWKDKKASLKMAVLAKADGVRQTINSIIDKINKNVIAKIKLQVPKSWPIIGGFKIGPPPNIPRFAKGGFPEEGPFMMNRGEIAGKFSNGKNVVANNQQITDGIANAVYRAFVSASAGGVSESTFQSGIQQLITAVRQIDLSLGDEEVARSATRGQAKLDRRFHPATT